MHTLLRIYQSICVCMCMHAYVFICRYRHVYTHVQAVQLAISRLRALQVEHDLVYFTLRGATVFFAS